MDTGWIFSPENRSKLLKFRFEDSEKNDEMSHAWRSIYEFGVVPEPKTDSKSSPMLLENAIVDDEAKEQEVLEYIMEGLQTGFVNLKSSDLDALSATSLIRVLTKLKPNMDSSKLMIFCEGLCNWGSECPVIGVVFRELILPQFLGVRGSSRFLTELTRIFPKEFCNEVLIPLLEEQYDADIVSSVISTLGQSDRVTIVRKLLQKRDLNDCDWCLVLYVLTHHTNDLDAISWDDVTMLIATNAELKQQHQQFAKILVLVAKNNDKLSKLGRERIISAASTNKTLLRKQMLKYLDI